MKKQKMVKFIILLFLAGISILFLTDNTVFAASSTGSTSITKSYVGGYIDYADVFTASVAIDGVKYSASDDLDFSKVTAFWIEGKYVVAVLTNNKITQLYETDEPDKSAASSQLKSLVEDVAYGVPVYKQTNEGAIASAAQDLENAINTYLEKLGIVLSEEADSLEDGNTAERLRAIDEVTNDKVITMVSGTPDAVIDAVYAVYAMYLDTCVDTGVDLGKIDLSDLSKNTIEISTKLVNKIQNSMTDDVFTAKTGKYTVTFNITGIWGANTGMITVSTGKAVYTGIINTNTKKTARIMSEYINELSDLAKSAYKKAVFSLISYFSKATGIGELATKEWKNLFKDITTILQQNNHGNIPKNIVKMSEFCESIKILKNNETIDDVKKTFKEIENIYKKIKDIPDYTDDEVSDKAATIALKQVNRIKDNLLTEIYNYLYDPANSVVVSKENLWTKMKKLIFQCPVDIEVYDSNGILSGSTANGEESFNNSLLAEINGDVKTIYLPDNANVTIKIIATGNGEMDYVVEQIENGSRTGRLNYYDIVLSKGESYTQKLPVSSSLVNTFSLPLETSSGEKVYASEYLSADTAAVVKVSCTADTGGMVYGDSVYAKGSSVELSANATDDNYVFAGWYVNGKLAELKNTYRFCAKENLSVRAAFKEKRVKDEDCIIKFGKNYEDFAGINVYINNTDSGLRDIVMGLDGADTDTGSFSTVTVKKYSPSGDLINSEVKSTNYDGNFSFWLTSVNLENCTKMEVLDVSGDIIVTLGFSNTSVPIATIIKWYEAPVGYSLSADIYIGDNPNCSFSCWAENESDTVILLKYLGSTDNICIPGKLQIGNKVYNVCLKENAFLLGVFNHYATVDNVTKVTFSEINGQKVELGPDKRGLFEEYFNALKEVDLSGLDTSSTTSMRKMFAGCSSLASIDISTLDTGNVTDMENMFAGCSNLVSLDISGFNMSNVVNMDGMFYNCENLQTVVLGSLNTSKATNMHAMFSACNSLNTLDLKGLDTSNVTDFSTMFSGCKSLENLDLSGMDTRKAENLSYMFNGCNNLHTVDFGGWNTSNVKKWFTLSDCENLDALDLSSFEINVDVTINIPAPKTFVTLKYMVNGSCLQMEDLYYNESKNQYYRDFTAGDGAQITLYLMTDGEHIAEGAIRQHSGVFGNNHKVAWIYDSTKTLTIFGDGPMEDYNADYQVPYTYVDYYSGSDNVCVVDEDDIYEKVIIEEGVTRIGNNAFCSARNLKDIKIPESVAEIGEYAFSGSNGSWDYGSSLSNIAIPSSVTSLGKGVFNGCVNLKSITLPENLISIPDYAFCGCESIETITIPNSVKQIGKYAFMNCNNLVSIKIPNGVDSISERTFFGCSSLSYIVLSDRIKEIAFMAFNGCDKLTDVYYAGSKSQWYDISFDSYNETLTQAIIHFNSGAPSGGSGGAASGSNTEIPSGGNGGAASENGTGTPSGGNGGAASGSGTGTPSGGSGGEASGSGTGTPSGGSGVTSSKSSTGTKPGGKSKQSIKLSKTKKVLKAKTLSKKKITFIIKVKGVKGSLQVKSSKKKYIQVKASSNKVKITCKKGTEKGIYYIKIKAKKTSKYKATGWRTLKIAVK